MVKIRPPLDQTQIGPASSSHFVTIIPYGRLKERAAPLRTLAHDAVQAITALVAAYPHLDQMLRQGRFELRQNSPEGAPLLAEDLVAPLSAASLHLLPAIEGSGKGRGKAVLGLTLLGLSFIPGVNAGIGQAFSGFGQSLGGEALATSFQHFGTQLLGRTGTLLLLSGLSEAVAPQTVSPAGSMPSHSLPTPSISGQGAAIPLAYGEVRISQPVVISSGLDVDVIE